MCNGGRCSGTGDYVPLSIQGSRVVSWLWLHTGPRSWLTYERGRWLAKRLP